MSLNISEPRLGTCYMMCPLKEINLREREGLLHSFEIDKSGPRKKPKADISKVVKCFNRPAAGRKMPESNELRPGPVLLMTIRYLFTEIATKTSCDWIVVYDFIFDRLRAIRQDLVIQQLDFKTSICIYEKIVRFHVYAEQRLCERNISQYDPKINMQHLIECIEQLMILYDFYEENPTKVDLDISENTESIVYHFDRVTMECLYILLRLGQTTGLKRGLSLPKYLRELPEVQLALKISFAWFLKNYTLTCRMLQSLSPLLKCAALCNLRTIRREALLIMNHAYSSKNLTFPAEKLREILMYKNVERLEQDCKLFNLLFDGENVSFRKLAFKESENLANPETVLSEEELRGFLLRTLE